MNKKTKILIIILLALTSLSGFSQNDPKTTLTGTTGQATIYRGAVGSNTAMLLPQGTHAEIYPDLPLKGRIQLNSQTNKLEVHDGTKWVEVSLPESLRDSLIYIVNHFPDKADNNKVVQLLGKNQQIVEGILTAGGFSTSSSVTAGAVSANNVYITQAAPVNNYDATRKDYVDTGLSKKVDNSKLAQPQGVATLDTGGKVPLVQLPNAVMTFNGNWNAATNTPALSNGTGSAGMIYFANAPGTVNFGAENITFNIGDFAIYGGDGKWFKSSNSNDVLSVSGKTGIIILNKQDVGLSNVDNTSDINKPVSALAQTALDTKQPTLVSGSNIKTIEGQSVVGSGNIDINKSDVGLSNVDNTSDINKPVSVAAQTVLDTKQPTLVSGNNIKMVEGQSLVGSGSIDLNKSDVGLSNVDNTSDSNKPISTATKNALDNKADLAGGKIPLIQIPDSLIGAVNYQGTYDASTNTPALPSANPNKGKYWVVSVEGTQSSVLYKIGDWIISNGTTWDKLDQAGKVSSVAGKTGAVALVKSDIGLSNVDNTSDINKPVSGAQAAVNAAKANIDGSNTSGVWPISVSGVAAEATLVRSTAGTMKYHWQDGKTADVPPTWLWGGTDVTDMYVYRPEEFPVSTATKTALDAKLDKQPDLVQDFNTTTGFSLLEGDVYAVNRPNTDNAWAQGIQFSTNHNSSYANQLVFDITGQLYTRTKYDNYWNSWSKIPLDQNILHTDGTFETKTGILNTNSTFVVTKDESLAVPNGMVFRSATNNNLKGHLGLHYTGKRFQIQGFEDLAGVIPVTINENGGNVGIGTSTPTASLQVVGSQNNNITNSTAISKVIGSDTGLNIGVGAAGLSYATWLQAMRESDGLTFPLLINPIGGNVGIGTTVPSAKLDVNGSVNATRLNLASGDNLTWGGAYADRHSTISANDSSIGFYPGGGTQAVSFNANGDVNVETGSISSRFRQLKSNYINLPSGAERWVKLFTTSSDNNLSAKIEASMTSQNSVNGFTIDIRGGYYDSTSPFGKPFVEVVSESYNERLKEVMVLKESGQLAVYMLVRANDYDVALFWNLESVDGYNVAVSNSLAAPANTTGSFVLPSGFVKANNYGFTQSINGNVGVGTTNPDVFGRAYTTMLGINSDNATGLSINGTSQSDLDLGLAGSRAFNVNVTGTERTITSYGDKKLHINVNGDVRQTIDGSGNTGFGTTSPAYKVDINGTGRFSGALKLERQLEIAGNNYIGFNSNTWTYGYSSAYGGMNLTKEGSTAGVIFAKDNGNVGINSLNPISKFQVKAGTNVNTGFLEAIEGRMAMTSYNDTGDANIPFDIYASETTFRLPGLGEAARISSNGNVGIGTTSPEAKLDIWSAASPSDLIMGRIGSLGVKAFSLAGHNQDANNAGLIIKTQKGGVMTEAIRILANGNIGVNETAPTEKFYVNGNSTITGNLTTNNTLTVNGNGYSLAQFQNNGSNRGFIGQGDYAVTGGNPNGFGISAINDLQLSAGNALKVTIKGTTGNVLIGTAVDSGYKVDVNGTARFNGEVTVPNGTVSTSAVNRSQLDGKANSTGTNASGTWPVNITGTAANATYWNPFIISDFNTQTGFKLLQSYNQPSNGPVNSWSQGIQFSTNNDPMYVNQLVYDMTGNLFSRTKYAGSWGGWNSIPFDKNVVHLYADETIGGIKHFQDGVKVPRGLGAEYAVNQAQMEEVSISRNDYHINTTYSAASDYDKLDKDYPDVPIRFKVYCRNNNTIAEKIDIGLWVITSVVGYYTPKR